MDRSTGVANDALLSALIDKLVALGVLTIRDELDIYDDAVSFLHRMMSQISMSREMQADYRSAAEYLEGIAESIRHLVEPN